MQTKHYSKPALRSAKYHSTLSLSCKDIICFCNYRDMLPRAELLFKLCLKMKSRFSDDKLFLVLRRRSFFVVLFCCSLLDIVCFKINHTMGSAFSSLQFFEISKVTRF